MAKRKKSVADGFPDITQENLGELALLCLRRCDHYYGAKQPEDDLKVTDAELEEYVRTLFKDEWANVNLKKDLSSYDTPQLINITFLGAVGLHSSDVNLLADPYIRIAYHGTVYFSSVKMKTLNPCWNESILIGPVKPDDRIEIEIWDWDPRTFLGNIAKVKDIRSFRGFGIYLRELFKCSAGDDYLGGVRFSFREARSRPHLFRRDVMHSLETNGRALQRRLATGLSNPLKTICCLQAVHKAIVKYSMNINGVVIYDLALDLTDEELSHFETVELRQICAAYNPLIGRMLTFKAFIPQTLTSRIHLMGVLSFCSTLRKFKYHGALELAERRLNSFIIRLGQQKSNQLAKFKGNIHPLLIILGNLKVTTNILRNLNDLVHMAWSRHLSEVARESLEKFAVSYGDSISALTVPEDALKTYQVLKVFCDDFKIPIRILNRCFSENTVEVWMQNLETEAPYWSRYVARQDLILARTITSVSGQLLSRSCEEFLSRLHHNLAGIYEMTSKSLQLSEIYARTLCTCGLHYVTQLATATEDQKLLAPTGYSSGFNRTVCVVLNNMASTYALIVADLEEMVESREASERKQWKHLSSAGDDVFHRWSPRQTLTDIRKIFETTAEEFAERLADDISDVIVTVCESGTVEEVRHRAAKMDKLLGVLFNSLKTSTYPSLFRILLDRMYAISLDNLAEIVTNIRMDTRAERVVFATAVRHCCEVLEAFFLDEKYALPCYKVKTPRHSWIRDAIVKLTEKDSTESSLSILPTKLS
ncbi:uncharacterized protein LOC111245865 isoform X1 [Varroa destructor]|uniref:C2 domain-containing protein n=1 Tax=Varroa destructor TaxID=109461 RepID=A0A7M7JDN3_VARDE|nr:uncharacterized protein LOC111245865 isoform X1 [Varroa destructor]